MVKFSAHDESQDRLMVLYRTIFQLTDFDVRGDINENTVIVEDVEINVINSIDDILVLL